MNTARVATAAVWVALAMAPASAQAKPAGVRPRPVVGDARVTAAPFASLDVLLRTHVRGDGLVDYERLRAKDLPRLAGCLEQMATIDAATLEPAERVAYWINLYNATVLRAVCDRLSEGWTPAAAGYAMFDAPLVRTRDGTRSLNQFEHGVILPGARDPRVHFALVCAARSCPVMRKRAYRGGDLDSLLDANVRAFLKDPSRNRVDAATRTLRLSRIFDWYAADFGGAGRVPAYVGRALGRDFSGWKVEFLDYDWSLNRAAGR